MKKIVPILAIAGGISGIISSFLFYVFGTLSIGILFIIVKSIIPVLEITNEVADIQTIIYINSITSSILCIASVIAGILYLRGERNEGQKGAEKYVSAVALVTAAAGLALTFSFFSVIMPGIAAVAGLISVRSDFKNGLVSDPEKTKKIIIISAALSAVILGIIYTLPRRYF